MFSGGLAFAFYRSARGRKEPPAGREFRALLALFPSPLRVVAGSFWFRCFVHSRYSPPPSFIRVSDESLSSVCLPGVTLAVPRGADDGCARVEMDLTATTTNHDESFSIARRENGTLGKKAERGCFIFGRFFPSSSFPFSHSFWPVFFSFPAPGFLLGVEGGAGIVL